MVKMGFLPNVFALNTSMQRHPNTDAHTNTMTHILLFAHTRDLWINSKALVWQGNTGNFRQLPLPACQTWGSRSVQVVFDFFCLLNFICQSQLMLLYKKSFDRISVLFWIFTLTMVTSKCTWWDIGRACISERKKVTRHDVTWFLPKRGNYHSVKLKWNMFSTHYFCFAPGRLSNVFLFPSFFFVL